MVLFYSAFNAKKKQFMKKKMYPSNSALRKKNWSQDGKRENFSPDDQLNELTKQSS